MQMNTQMDQQNKTESCFSPSSDPLLIGTHTSL